MIGLSFALSYFIVKLIIKINKLEPTDNFYGSDSKNDLIERAKEVIYYKCLSNTVSYVYPVIAAILLLINISEDYINEMLNNFTLSILIAIVLSLFAIVFSKLYTYFRIKIVIKKNQLRRYIGELWHQIIDDN